MAVQPWELVGRERPPALTLVPAVPTPPAGKPFFAGLFVIFVALAIGTPAIAEALQPDPEVQRWVPRPQPATQVAAIDPIGPLARSQRPSSGEPFAGMLFVRCTRLWAASPDGSHARKILEMPGIASPAIAPNARTVAFLVDADGRQELWMAQIDGAEPQRMGALASQAAPLPARASGLTWSPKGDQLAFALTDGRYGEFEGGSAIWALNLASGEFSREGSGWPAPFWADGKLAWANRNMSDWAQFHAPRDRRSWMVKSTRTSKHDLAAALVPSGYSYNVANGAAVFRVVKGTPQLVIKHLYRSRKQVIVEAPSGYTFETHARPSIAQDGSSVAIDLVDGSGERDLGIFHTSTKRWNVLDYAWESVSSPAPVLTEPIAALRARTIVSDLLNSWNTGGARRNLMIDPGDQAIFQADARWGLGYVLSTPQRVRGAWIVPVTAYMHRGDDQVWLRASLVVGAIHDRLHVDVQSATAATPLRTVSDAIEFTETALERDVAAPPLPAETELQQSSLYAYSYNGSAQISFNAEVPFESASGLKAKDITFGFGDDLDFSMGCGGEVDPQPIQLDDTPAVVDSSGKTHQVIWPSTMEDRSGTHSVYGYGIPKSAIVGIARSMASSSP